ncbi:LysE family translocator [Robiginitomaculum antarcticum]|uniref:LysE family translocator n=1 Tax=Robiginitomaculum antarcticum TaxID=437507 RepID=UPI00037A9977|nr:LysE family translocator [Robiginitomaculum antarcticum]
MDVALFWGLLAFTASGSITPGPNNLILMSQGVTFGFRRCIPYIFGVAAGFGTLLLAACLGLGAVVQALPALLPIISIIGALWLMGLAWGYVKPAAKSMEGTKAKPAPTRPLGFIEATLFQWVNPKGLVFAFGAAASFTGLAESFWLRTAIIIAVFIATGFIGNALWAGMGGTINRILAGQKTGRALNLFLGAVIFATALFVLWIGLKPLLAG